MNRVGCSPECLLEGGRSHNERLCPCFLLALVVRFDLVATFSGLCPHVFVVLQLSSL